MCERCLTGLEASTGQLCLDLAASKLSFFLGRVQDYPLPLLNAPSEAAVLKLRTEMFRVSETARQSLLEEEEQRLWRIVETKALEAATLARLEHRCDCGTLSFATTTH